MALKQNPDQHHPPTPDGTLAYRQAMGETPAPVKPTPGDAFNAGLIAALTEGEGWPAALAAATSMASEIIARPSGNRHRAAPRRPG